MDSLNILNRHGYFNRHLQLCKESRTQKEAWEKLEQEFEIKYNTSLHVREAEHFKGYNSFESFRSAKTRFYNNKSNR